MAKLNFNNLKLTNKKYGVQEVGLLNSNMLINTNILPKPVGYRDVDLDMFRFVKEQLGIYFDDVKIPVFFLTQQRFSEYSKIWEHVDEHGNIHTDFIIITRENNPKKGSQHHEYFNIPGNDYYEIGTSEKWSGDKNILVKYKMKQPYCVDFVYYVKIITSKLTLLNLFNSKVQDTFKALQSYISPNEHHMPVTLDDIADDSEYDLEERKILVQTFTFNVLGYIINESDLKIEEIPVRLLGGFELDQENAPTRYGNDKDKHKLIFTYPVNYGDVIETKIKDYYLVTGVTGVNVDEYNLKINNTNVVVPFFINKFDKVYVKIKKSNDTVKSFLNFNYIDYHTPIYDILPSMVLETGEYLCDELNNIILLE